MKTTILGAVTLLFAFFFSSCSKEQIQGSVEDLIVAEEADFSVPSSGYEINIVENLTTAAEAGYYNGGAIEYVQEGNLLARVDFGSGDEEGTFTLSSPEGVRVMNMDRPEAPGDRHPCGHLVFPLSIIQNNGAPQTINSPAELHRILQDCRANGIRRPDCFEFVFPIGMMLRDSSILTINSEQELKDFFRRCRDANGGHGPRPPRGSRGERGGDCEKIVVQPLVKTNDCDYIVSGIVKYFKGGEWMATIDFGDGTCDDIAVKETKAGQTTLNLSDLFK